MKCNKMDESNSKMAAGCNVSLYRLWTVQIGLVSCWEKAVHTCTLKQNKDPHLEGTRFPVLGENMNLQINCIHGELGLCISGLANFSGVPRNFFGGFNKFS